MLTTLLTFLGSLLGLAWWRLRRKHEPTPQQRLDDVTEELNRLRVQLAAARADGDDARADALLRRLRQLALAPGAGAQRPSGAAGQRGPGHAAQGD
jgi:hypothetical protein